ncbi:MAG: hypothetical protein ACI8P3_001202 [Saprospiraceae bacterium]|jgi:hypothetical protein
MVDFKTILVLFKRTNQTMTAVKLITLISGILFAFSCGNIDSTSNKEIAATNTTLAVGNVLSDSNISISADPGDLVSAEKELIVESMNVEAEDKNSLPEKNQKAINTLKPIAVNQKIPKQESTKVIDAPELPLESENDIEIKVEEKEETKPVIKPVEKEPVNTQEVIVFSHDVFDQLLKKYVSSKGKVNYSGFKADESKLDAYLKALDENPPAAVWSKNKKMAYWINAYNAGTIKLILKNYPISSITKLHGGKPWDQKWIPLGGKTYSLNNIENDILRPVFKDARIHFAVNCAAKSCPPLLNSAWTESNLSQNLDKQSRSFVNDANQNKLTANALEISKIFEWYAADFGNIVDFLNKYAASKINPGAKVTYKEYNWDLNK